VEALVLLLHHNLGPKTDAITNVQVEELVLFHTCHVDSLLGELRCLALRLHLLKCELAHLGNHDGLRVAADVRHALPLNVDLDLASLVALVPYAGAALKEGLVVYHLRLLDLGPSFPDEVEALGVQILRFGDEDLRHLNHDLIECYFT
jgi:hypothetical protein